MSDTAIRVQGLSKLYRIGSHLPGGKFQYAMLRDRIQSAAVETVQSAKARLGLRPPEPRHEELLWALKDVSFEVPRGQVMGIIGRNGSGKSTLLKILSRVIDPTEGIAEVHGRVGSLLEVGTGFHPELTGRENVYLNGAILGMRRTEIQRKFDEIVEFSEIARFIDTPVKHYSSGMYVRLAFAVAAHLEPEILMMDEVLAVGDAEFQKKCLGKMDEVAKGGRTVLFVSHNMAAVENLCQHGILLHRGQLAYMGTASDAIARYLRGMDGEATMALGDRTDRHGSGKIRITAIEFRDADNQVIDTARSGQDIDIYLYYERAPDFQGRRVNVTLRIATPLDAPVFGHNNRLSGRYFDDLPPSGAFVLRVPRLPLAAQTYPIHLTIHDGKTLLDRLDRAGELRVVSGNFFGHGELPPVAHGPLLVDGDWRLETTVVEPV